MCGNSLAGSVNQSPFLHNREMGTVPILAVQKRGLSPLREAEAVGGGL